MQLADRCYKVILHYGFKQEINLPRTLKYAYQNKKFPMHVNLDKALYFTEQTDVIITDRKLRYMFKWQKQLFGLLFRNATTDISYYNLPHDRTVTLGNFSQI
jgi:KUP system potassium uptake protein